MALSTELCATCHEPLVLEVEPDSDYEDTAGSSTQTTSVPDDVELSCGCHYHWECIISSYTITQCPSCSRDISSQTSGAASGQQVLCTVRNEGGEQHNFDILPLAQEEAFLRTYPEERRGHAFLEFCREGDVDAIVHLVKDDDEELEDEEEEEGGKEIDVLRYVGSFGSLEGSGLHIAIANGQVDVAWLLLFLGSGLDIDKFPQNVLQGAKGLGLELDDRSSQPDIRSLKDSDGLTAADVAQRVGGQWSEWLSNGLLRP